MNIDSWIIHSLILNQEQSTRARYTFEDNYFLHVFIMAVVVLNDILWIRDETEEMVTRIRTYRTFLLYGESRNYIDHSRCDVLKCALLKLYPETIPFVWHVETAKSTDCERAINQQSCNQRAYVTICVPRVYRLDGLTRRTPWDFNKRNRRRLSERPKGGRNLRAVIAGETAWGQCCNCSCSCNFIETTTRVQTERWARLKVVWSRRGLRATASTMRTVVVMEGKDERRGRQDLWRTVKSPLHSGPRPMGRMSRARSCRPDLRRIIIPHNYSVDARVRERREIKSA